MSSVFKFLTIEAALSAATPNTVSNAALVRCVNPTTGALVVTQANTGGNIASFTIDKNQEIVVRKAFTDTLLANGAGIVVTSVAFTH